MVLRGLVGAAELNGRRGTVRRFEKERYTILIDRSEEKAAEAAAAPQEKSNSVAEDAATASSAAASPDKRRQVRIKFQNLMQMMKVRRFPGAQKGKIVGVLREGGGGGVEYEVEIGAAGREAAAWCASECLLPRGTCVRFAGLVGAAHLNGRAGLVRGANLEARRYSVAYVAQEGDPAPSSTASGAAAVGGNNVVRKVHVRFQNVEV